MSLTEFSVELRKAKGPHIHKITNSYGVYDYYKYYRKNKPSDPKYILKDVEYYKIIRKINEILANKVINGEDVTFPFRMGGLELRKIFTIPKIKPDGTLQPKRMVDWSSTIKLWYEDEEAFRNKTLVRVEEREAFLIYYNRIKATFKNKTFYQLQVNKGLKRALAKRIKGGKVDAFMI